MGNVTIGRRLALSAAACVALGLLSACNFSASANTGGKIARADVEEQVLDAVEAKTGDRPTSVDCPSDMQARTGATMRCTLTASDDATYGVTVTVTSVVDRKAKFNIKVDDAPTPSESAEPDPSESAEPDPSESAAPDAAAGKVAEADVEEKIADVIEDETGDRPTSVDCPEDLVAEVGTTMRCTLTKLDDKEYGVTITVKSITDNKVKFGIVVDDEPTP